MAAYFVDSNAAGAGTGADWANAYTTIALALARPILAGDTLWVGDDHNESTAGAVTWTFPGTVANLNFVYCVDHTKASPGSGDLKTTASVTTTAGGNCSINGSIYFYGITFHTSGNWNGEADTTTPVFQRYDTCLIENTGAGGSNTQCGSGNAGRLQRMEWNNTQVKFASTSNIFRSLGASFTWRNTPSAVLGTFPSPLLVSGAGGVSMAATIIWEGVDLSALGTGKTILGWSTAGAAQPVFLKDCKFGSSVTVTGTPAGPGADVYVTRSDSSGTNYIEQVYKYTGTQVDETTIVRTGGATDGTTPKSRKITTTANSKWVLPFEGNPIAIWNNTISPNSVTVTIHGTWNQSAVPNNDDIWINVEYLGASTSPLGSFATNTKANNLATGTPLTADTTSTWGGGGSGAGWSPFVMSVQLATPKPAQVGTIYVYVEAAKATSTFYIDPLITLSTP